MFDRAENPAALGFDADRLARFGPWMRRWIDSGRLPGAEVLIARRGEVVHHEAAGLRDVAAGTAWDPGTAVRIYSMTKPITSVAALTLFEEARVHLDTPVDEILPEFADRRVLVEGATRIDQTRPAATRLTLHHLLTHTSGLTYGFNEGVLSAEMRERKLDFSVKEGDLADTVRRLAELPLAFDPGARWNYGVSTDVVGRIVEVVAGKPLPEVFAERILGPLGMTETGFEIPAGCADRFAACYVLTPEDPLKLMDPGGPDGAYAPGKVRQPSGGGGLISTAPDYLKFAEMLRGGGALGDVRILSPKSVELMTANALGGDLASMGQPVFSEVSFDGVGFGLGVSVTLDAARSKTAATAGDYGWGGMASTMFWVDPARELTAIFLTQLVPSSSYPIRKEMRALTHAALVAP